MTGTVIRLSGDRMVEERDYNEAPHVQNHRNRYRDGIYNGRSK